MDPKLARMAPEGRSRRKFLQTAGIGLPTLALLLEDTSAASGDAAGATWETASKKFAPIDLSGYFNVSPNEFGPRVETQAADHLVRTPTGKRVFRGIPFQFGPEGLKEKSWVMLTARAGGPGVRTLDVPAGQPVSHVCLVAFADFDENEAPPPGKDLIEKVGQHLADAVFLYADGSEQSQPLRRRFEVDSPGAGSGFASLPLGNSVAKKLSDPLDSGLIWGFLQYGYMAGPYVGSPDGEPVVMLSVCALPNPDPSRTLKAFRLQATGDDPLVVCAITFFQGRDHPLRYERLSVYRLTLPEAAGEDEGRWKVDVDLGLIARNYVLGNFDSTQWLAASRKGLGEEVQPAQGVRHRYLEIAAPPDATLTLRDTKTGKQYEFDLGMAVPGRELEARPAGARLKSLDCERTWLHVQVADPATGFPTPVRVSFRSKDGRYIPPYGHRTEINDGWFQDYGADLKLTGSSFAYVEGKFQVELPVGEVYVEMTKGFEYEPVRRKLEIKPGQHDLRLEIPRFANLRPKGWVTADVHVHFLSPPTAVLEGQAEGLNLINLLAAQWGDLFTNVGDLTDVPLKSRDGETIVWMGTENRQHLLGHINLLGGRGDPAFPLSAAGPEPSYLGDPVWSTMAEWADACRKREGVVVWPHFPYPTAEFAADIVLGKIDALEIYPWSIDEHFNGLNYRVWYRLLNCGYRLPATGGTDKMAATTPIGYNRTYANIGQDEFSFATWARAIRRGNTFATTGPLLFLQVDGHPPGEEIALGVGGGTVEVTAEAQCFVPIHRLDLVMNGQVVATREEHAGARELILKEKVQVPGASWLAARCYSREGPLRMFQNSAIAAHTSPVYMRVPGQELFSKPAAAYMLTLIEGCQAWLETVAIRPDQERYARIRKVFDEAHARLHRRIQEKAGAR